MKNRNMIIAAPALCALLLLSGCVRSGEDGAGPAGTESTPAISTGAPTASSSAPQTADAPASSPNETGDAGEEAAAGDSGVTPGAGSDGDNTGGESPGGDDAGQSTDGDDAGGTEMEETDDILDDILRQLDELEDIYSDVEEDDVSDADLNDS